MLKTKDGWEIPCICVTNRRLCRDDFLGRVERIAGSGSADAILLREKDLPEEEYRVLAEKVLKICERNSVICLLHTYFRVAMEFGCRNVHLPLGILQEISENERNCFERLGSSVHSVREAEEAVRLGASYVTAGHVFATACKEGLPGRGTGFVEQVCRSVSVPVFGIGGIREENANRVVRAGARGVCIMSGFMVESPEGL